MILIEARELSKTYVDDGVVTPALKSVSFDIKKGEFVAIMGPSGSGKSTLLHLLGFLDRPSGGMYRFDGRSIDEYSDHELADVRNRKMGFVFQTFNLLPRTTTLENVKLPLLYSGIPEKKWNHLAEEAVEAVGLTHRIHHESSKLSGGERQRVAIARALVLTPEIIFADEPTGNLDSKSGQAIMSILEQLNRARGHTIILITHETYTAEQAERIIHLHDGELVKDEKVRARRTSEHFVK
jgi:putative ABC transport system ATP-binding protein